MRVEPWVMFSILAMLSWGLWGFFPKLALRHLDPTSSLLYQELGAVLVGLVILVMIKFQPQYHPTGVIFAIIAGAAAMVGGLFYLYALRTGQVSVVVTISALYPVVVITLASLFLGETLTIKQGAGVLFAITAIVLFVI